MSDNKIKRLCDGKTEAEGVSDDHSTDGGDGIEAESGTKGDQYKGKRNELAGHPQRGGCSGKGEHHKKEKRTQTGSIALNQFAQEGINGACFPHDSQRTSDDENKENDSLCICKRSGYDG